MCHKNSLFISHVQCKIYLPNLFSPGLFIYAKIDDHQNLPPTIIRSKKLFLLRISTTLNHIEIDRTIKFEK